MESDILERLSLICPEKTREELAAIIGFVPRPKIGDDNDWLMQITEHMFAEQDNRPFPLFNLNDDLFATIFSDYLNIRDKMAVGLVCHRFRNLIYWPNFKLEFNWNKMLAPQPMEPSDRLLPLNEYKFELNRWKICLNSLLDRVIVREFRLEMEECEYPNLDRAELIEMLNGRADRFKIKSLNISFSTPSALPVFQSFLDHPAMLDSKMDSILITNDEFSSILALNAEKVAFLDSLITVFSQRQVKCVGFGQVFTIPQYTRFCNLLAPGSLLKLNVPCMREADIPQLIGNLNAGAASQLKELTFSLSQFQWAQSFIHMIPAMVRIFPNLTHLHACLHVEAWYNGGTTTNDSSALLDAFLQVECLPQLHVTLEIPYDLFLRLTRRVAFTQSGDFTYIWSNDQLNLTCKVYGGQLLYQIREVLFKDPSLGVQQLAHKSHLTPCESLAFRDELNAKYGGVVLWPGPQCAKKFGHFTLTWNQNKEIEVIIAVLLCANPSCDVCIYRGD